MIVSWFWVLGAGEVGLRGVVAVGRSRGGKGLQVCVTDGSGACLGRSGGMRDFRRTQLS